MATLPSALIRNFALAKQQTPSLTKGQYMQRAFPGRYKNEQSAYQAYNKTVSGKRSGGRLAKASEPDRTMVLRGKKVPRGAYEEGLWKVVIHYSYIDENGDTISGQEASFNARSMEHTNLLATPYLQDAIVPTAEQYLMERTGKRYEGAEIEYIEILPINTYQVAAYDLDEIVVGYPLDKPTRLVV